MQSDGAWTMVMPRSRHALRTGSAALASSPQRAAADLHQWSSHMSQTTTAVFAGSSVTFSGVTVTTVTVSVTIRPSAFFFARVSVMVTRLRAVTSNFPVGSAAQPTVTPATTSTARTRIRVMCRPSWSLVTGHWSLVYALGPVGVPPSHRTTND